MIRRTIREWERIGYGTDETTIPAPQADRIAAQARTSSFSGLGGEGVLEHGPKGTTRPWRGGGDRHARLPA